MLGVKERASRKKCKMRFSLIKKNKAAQKNDMKVGVKKLLRADMVPARTCRVHAVVIAPTEMATQYWAERVWMENGVMNNEKLGRNRFEKFRCGGK